jgi:hypothetical protein
MVQVYTQYSLSKEDFPRQSKCGSISHKLLGAEQSSSEEETVLCTAALAHVGPGPPGALPHQFQTGLDSSLIT